MPDQYLHGVCVCVCVCVCACVPDQYLHGVCVVHTIQYMFIFPTKLTHIHKHVHVHVYIHVYIHTCTIHNVIKAYTLYIIIIIHM